MLVKKFVPCALMQQHQQTTLVDDLCEVVGSVGYFLLDPTFSSTVANVSVERTLLHDFFFYHHNKMRLKERMIASKATVAVQEALIRGGVYDVRGLGTKVMHSSLYGTSFQWVDIPDIRTKYTNLAGTFDFSSCIMIKPSSSQLTKLKSNGYYLDEINQDLTAIKKGRFTLLEPTLVKGWLKYPLLDTKASVRLDFTNYAKMRACLGDFTDGIPLMKNLKLSKLDHALITARTGLGKSFLAFSLSAELGKSCVQYYLDPKHSDLSSFGHFLGRGRYADSPKEIDNRLIDLVSLMSKRYKMMHKMAELHPSKYVGASADEYGFKPVVVFFDEVSAYLASSKKGLKALKKLLMLGRQAQIFIVLILQDPRVTDNLPSTIKDQTSIRIALGKLTGTLAGLVFGSGTELPEVPRDVGQGYIQVDGGEVKLFEAPTMPTNSGELYELMKQSLKGQKELDPLRRNYFHV